MKPVVDCGDWQGRDDVAVSASGQGRGSRARGVVRVAGEDHSSGGAAGAADHHAGDGVIVRPGALGKIDKFRQDRHYLHPTWQDVYRPERANIEGLNGRAKSHSIDISDPTKRLAHGRVAQTILLALMICSINLHILFSWQQTTGVQTTDALHDVAALIGPAARRPDATGLSPPMEPEIRETT